LHPDALADGTYGLASTPHLATVSVVLVPGDLDGQDAAVGGQGRCRDALLPELVVNQARLLTGEHVLDAGLLARGDIPAPQDTVCRCGDQ